MAGDAKLVCFCLASSRSGLLLGDAVVLSSLMASPLQDSTYIHLLQFKKPETIGKMKGQKQLDNATGTV